nr:MAG: replication associated protein [Cressdnaviricota sp.]
MSRVRNYCFTSHVGKIQWTEAMQYLVQGEEVGEGGKEHIQGFVVFRNKRAIGGVIKEFKGVHWEVCLGTPLQNMEYCKKEGRWEEQGQAPVGAGKRTDCTNLVRCVMSGLTDKEILELPVEPDKPDLGMAFLRMHRGVDRVRSVMDDRKRDWVMDVRIYWGPTGSGKSRRAHEEFPDLYTKSVGKWWDGYKQEECVLIDDFDPTNCFDITFDMYLKLLDRYPMQVEVKGGYEKFLSKVVIFTSNFDPEEWFPFKGNRAAFFRRVTSIEYLGLGLGPGVVGGNTGPPPNGASPQNQDYGEILRQMLLD